MVSVDFSREYLDQWAEDRLPLPRENAEKVAALRESMSSQLNRPYNRRWWRNAVRLPVFSTDDFGIRDGVVCFGEDLSPDPGEKRVLRGALEDLKSWRKVPSRMPALRWTPSGEAISSGGGLWNLRIRISADAESRMWAATTSTTCTGCWNTIPPW